MTRIHGQGLPVQWVRDLVAPLTPMLRPARLGVVAALAVLVAGASGVRAGGAAPSPRIAFVRADGIYVIGLEDGRVRRLTRGARYADVLPSWAPDGHLAFVRRGVGVVVIGGNGRGERRITPRPSEATVPRWAPDSRALAFDDPERGVMVAHAPSWQPRLVVRGANPTWAPDSHQLAYGVGDSVHVIDLETKKDRRVSAGLPPFAWSPDGRRIAFHTDPGTISAMSPTGTHRNAVTNLPGLSIVQSIAWSPDSRRIALTAISASCECAFVVSATGGRTVKLGAIDASTVPAWAPDSRRLALSLRGTIYLVSADGRTRRKLTKGSSPAFSQ